MEVQKRREKKHEIVEKMIETYCTKQKHLNDGGKLCSDCDELLNYSLQRTTRCPHVEKTLFCVNCPTPCYKPDMKEKMRIMMKYSGPRFFFSHPLIVLEHVMYDFKTRKKDAS